MNPFYLVDNQNQLKSYEEFYQKHEETLQQYYLFLRKQYQVEELPQALIFANKESATSILREIAVPAYTNDIRMVMTPEKSVWQEIYLEQLDQYEAGATHHLRQHYQNLSDNHLLQIIGHELGHWSELFEDDFEDYESFIWFEEGMVEYISRKYFLTDSEFQDEKKNNQVLANLFQEKNGWHSLNDFGKATYDGDYASIFYEYWRSFLTVDQLVSKLGSEQAVFSLYHQWLQTGHSQLLLDWLIGNDFLEKEF